TPLSGEQGRWATRWGKFALISVGNITGQVFRDINSNGLIDGSDTTLNGVTVFLDANNNGTLDGGETFTTTAGSGNYTFSGVLTATYNVREVVPSGYAPTVPSGGVNSVLVSTGLTSIPHFGDCPLSCSGSVARDR